MTTYDTIGMIIGTSVLITVPLVIVFFLWKVVTGHPRDYLFTALLLAENAFAWSVITEHDGAAAVGLTLIVIGFVAYEANRRQLNRSDNGDQLLDADVAAIEAGDLVEVTDLCDSETWYTARGRADRTDGGWIIGPDFFLSDRRLLPDGDGIERIQRHVVILAKASRSIAEPAETAGATW